ncbi:GNAT family N-acetyltransferase [Streptomyces sp. CA-179760]|uniref:GNAT family N-acetyltransferase n=1 Tax=Streptomyces sp. CA-179760 TaxID=3240054 RepID=UPI003D92B933
MEAGQSPFPRVTALGQYTADDLHDLVGDDPDPFEVASLDLTWRPKEQHFGVLIGNRLVAHAGWVTVPVSAGGTTFQAAGLGGVVVTPELRGQGLARLAVNAAMTHATESGLEFGLLFCRQDRAPVYHQLGWTPLTREISVEQPNGTTTMPLSTMWKPLRDRALSWPSGPVRLLSLPM